jgi:hypothetical protein
MDTLSPTHSLPNTVREKAWTLNKYLITPLRQRLAAASVRQNQMEQWMKSWKFFFILGFGRSGTAFMADFLNHADDAHVYHEPVFEDFYAHLRAHYNPRTAEKYMQGFRKKEIYSRMGHISSGIYGETNGNLRCHANAIRNAFPNAPLLHLVRDGRDVVRSHMSRRTMTARNPFSMSMHPIKSDPWRIHWSQMDRFARICWYWQEENRRLRTSIGRTVQFEKILASYEYFKSEILDPCGINIEHAVWEASIALPRNISREFSMPKWDQWTPQQQQAFKEICGDEMAACGYNI